MSNFPNKKPCKNGASESQSNEKQPTLGKSLTSTATSFISQFFINVRRWLSNKQEASSDEWKRLVCKAEENIKEVYDKILKEIQVFRENELQSYEHYSKEELAKAEAKLKEYSNKMKNIFEELINRLQLLKNGFQTKIVTQKEYQSLIKYFDERIDQTKKLTQELIKNIHETIKDPDLKRKLIEIVENNYKRVKASIDSFYTAIKESNTIAEDKCRKSDLSTRKKSFHSTAISYINRIIAYASGFVSGKSGQTETQDLKSLLIITEVKIKELYDGILKKVKDLHENELQSYTNYSKDELAKVKTNLQEYSVKVKKLSEDMIRRLKDLKNQFQTRFITHEDYQSLVTYLEGKITETKKLTDDMIKHIQATIKDPALKTKLETMVETNSQKIKIALDELYTAIKKNVQLKSLPDKRSLFSKMPKFGKMMKTSIECSTTQTTLPNNGNEAVVTGSKENAAVGLNKEKIPFFNLSKHFNSKTIYGRANVAKATYASILIYYIYRKTKNTTS